MQATIERSVAVENADWKAQSQYAFTQTGRSDGRSRTSDVTTILGTRYRRLIAIDGRPLSAEEQDAENAKMQFEIQKRKSETPAERARRIARAQKENDEEHIMLMQLTKAFNFRLIGQENIAGHPAWVLEAIPRPGYQPPNQRAKVLTGMRGKLWIAKDGDHWVKVEAEVVKPVYFEGFLARVAPGTRFEMEKAPAGTGVWMPVHFAMKVDARILGVFSHHAEGDYTFSNYRRVAAAEPSTVAVR